MEDSRFNNCWVEISVLTMLTNEKNIRVEFDKDYMTDALDSHDLLH